MALGGRQEKHPSFHAVTEESPISPERESQAYNDIITAGSVGKAGAGGEVAIRRGLVNTQLQAETALMRIESESIER